MSALALAGCDTGGLLEVEDKTPPPGAPALVANEMVSGGTLAKSSKYRLFYTNGQGTPNQGPITNGKKKLQGGLAGTAHHD